MVVCLVDDLFFSIKIKTAAQLVNADIYFERTGNSVLQLIRAKQPRLVIFDLDSAKLGPMDIIRSMKAAPDLRPIPTLGFVSHVHADVIAKAREAGIDRVLARSAFAEQLGSILRNSGGPEPGLMGS